MRWMTPAHTEEARWEREPWTDGAIVTCPLHGWQYDVSSGACQTNPRVQMVCYEVRVEDKLVKVALKQG